MTPSVGTKLGNYRLERVLGEGRMGVVFSAYDEALLRRTAVKVLAWKFAADDVIGTPDAHMLAEAQLAARISHPNVVRVYSVARHGVHCFIGMEYIEGVSADVSVKQRGVFSFGRASEILLQVASGLQAVHDAKVVHRDLKPENVLIAADDTTKIVDFGMALPLVDSRSRDTNRAGTPLYTAPELWRGAPSTSATDLYALGATYYFLLTGKPPFEAKDLQTLIDAHQTAAIPDVRAMRPDVPEACHALIQRCLAKSPADRFASAQEVAWEAQGLLRQAAVGNPPPTRHATGSDRAASDTDGALRLAVFRPLGPEDPQVDGEPFDGLRARLAELIDDAGPAVALLIGDAASGRSTLARRLIGVQRRRGTAVYLGPGETPERAPLHEIARHLGVVVAHGDARTTVDRIIQQLASGRAPALVVVDRALSEPAVADLAVLGRGAAASGAFRLLVTGGPELLTALGQLASDRRTWTIAVPALTTAQAVHYIQERLSHARAMIPNTVVTPDAQLLVAHHSRGSLGHIGRMMTAMLARAASDHRAVVSSRDAWSVVDPASSSTAADDAAWPSAEVLEVLNASRRVIGLALRQRAAIGSGDLVELVELLPDVTGVVLSHVSGAVIDARGPGDAEVTAAANARSLGALAKIGERLGLGELRTTAIAGASATWLLSRRPGTVLTCMLDPSAAITPLEDQITRISLSSTNTAPSSPNTSAPVAPAGSASIASRIS